MVIVECEQGSPGWFQSRLGIPTASCFDKIITPTGKPSTQAEGYMNRLLAEWLIGKPLEAEVSEWMKRGIEMEAEARAYYEFRHDVQVRQVGLVYRDDRKLVSCSPDGLMDSSGLEIKCPAPWTHVGYMLKGGIPNDYIPQVQGSMYVTGLKEWHFISYHPDMEPVIATVKRDDQYIETLDELLAKFLTELAARRERLQHLRKAA